ncbi:hypothetical protein HanXRQr2_Chr01g0005481 [Helianthus annuus]|uniref:Uncharacterized protein n=1 Tax=Helianthus annuus TaxID=4232 RepID=A0A251VMC3_HELAN|nr:hypothetical protein HanXRQr2_Chr01g0005481 [Helianthus annuus]KAJ0610497.1 hypothetical protein HanHA300_Chr01g0004421 [Helianthus annuus]KAJ0621204.1 hypothetical protein HanIR_Chr01g0006051 [Helianthus annuus]KAJ0625742.1 hypothetical protein HanHA89_Chr01g0005071 [Helianthus annuus]KAJ0782112.1 hypothetical protein HanLR1_Chr01g0004421 [Helianthus annuus]
MMFEDEDRGSVMNDGVDGRRRQQTPTESPFTAVVLYFFPTNLTVKPSSFCSFYSLMMVAGDCGGGRVSTCLGQLIWVRSSSSRLQFD